MKEPCCAVSYSLCEANGHIPGGPLWMLEWLPKGYGVTLEDRLICAFFDTESAWTDKEYSVKNPPPLIAAVCGAIENHLREHPEDIAGHLMNALVA